MEFLDRLSTCADCGGEFIFTAGEQLFSQAKYCVWVPLIEVLEHCIESGQIGVSKNVGAVRKTHQSLTAAACR
jgi:hypothetical protein